VGGGRGGAHRAGRGVDASLAKRNTGVAGFPTEEMLRDVERAELVYAKSIGRLSAATTPSLDQSAAPVAAVYREKLALLDSAIAELKSNVAANRYNVYLQNQLASLYREKQKTLQEWLENAKRN
jgi:hypothetical protein